MAGHTVHVVNNEDNKVVETYQGAKIEVTQGMLYVKSAADDAILWFSNTATHSAKVDSSAS